MATSTSTGPSTSPKNTAAFTRPATPLASSRHPHKSLQWTCTRVELGSGRNRMDVCQSSNADHDFTTGGIRPTLPVSRRFAGVASRESPPNGEESPILGLVEVAFGRTRMGDMPEAGKALRVWYFPSVTRTRALGLARRRWARDSRRPTEDGLAAATVLLS